MKKLLLLLLMFSCVLLCFGQVTKTKKIYPKNTLLGLTKNGEVYKAQTTNEILIGYNEKTKISGRGYLEFDLKDIPKDAVIKYVDLLLTSKVSDDRNFNGKVRIEQALKYFEFYDLDPVTWNMLLPVAENPYNPPINMVGQGMKYLFSDGILKTLTQDKVKNDRKIALSITHTDESDILRLSIEKENLYLEVGYTSESGGSGESGGNDPNFPAEHIGVYGPLNLKPGNVYSYVAYTAVSNIKEWNIDNYFEVVKKENNLIRLRVKPLKGIASATISYIEKSNNNKRNDLKVTIIGDLSPILTGDKVVCSGNNISFSMPNSNEMNNTSIMWIADENLSLVSGQGAKTATFKASGNGYAKVKATITHNGKTYAAENSDVWVGAPKVAEIIKSPTSLCLNLQDNESRTIFAEIEGATDYKWTQITNNFKMLATFDHAYIVPKLNEGSMKMLCEASNKCGSAKRTHGIYAMWCNPDGTPIENVGGGGSRPPIGGGFNPNSMIISKSLETAPYEDIRIFSFYTGQTVYQEKNTIDFKIENTTLKSGIYIIESTDENGNITRTKVMKK